MGDIMTATKTKRWSFILYFKYKDARRAEKQRNESLIYLQETMKRSALFSVIAKDESNSSLILRGYMHLRNPCELPHVKKMMGKYSHCKPAVFDDIINLMLCYGIDKQCAVSGVLPSFGRTNLSAGFAMNVIREGKWVLNKTHET